MDLNSENIKMELHKVPVAKLCTGMILQQEVRNRDGLLIVARGQEVTHSLLMRLQNFSRARLIDNEIMVSVPTTVSVPTMAAHN